MRMLHTSKYYTSMQRLIHIFDQEARQMDAIQPVLRNTRFGKRKSGKG